MPGPAADDATLAADLHRWAADQPDRPSRNAVMRRFGIGATRANHLLAGLPRSGTGPVADHQPDQTGPAPDHQPDQTGPVADHGPVPLTTSRTTDGREA